MTVDELDRMRLNDACVVLSACESLRGWRAGADVFSLGRSFIAAGATTLVTSLWRIAEDTTAEQLSNFYAELAAGHSVCAALRRTQMRWLGSAKGLLAHPALWAPLVTFGADMILKLEGLTVGYGL
jgi:CHAT domain-containing protein